MTTVGDSPDRLPAICLTVRSKGDALACPSMVADFAKDAGATNLTAQQLEIAAAELATNLIRHAGGGTLSARLLSEPFSAIELVASDRGPGFADVDMAKRDGFSQGKDLVNEVPPAQRTGLGSGLGAVERLTEDLRIENREGGGAIVTALKRLP